MDWRRTRHRSRSRPRPPRPLFAARPSCSVISLEGSYGPHDGPDAQAQTTASLGRALDLGSASPPGARREVELCRVPGAAAGRRGRTACAETTGLTRAAGDAEYDEDAGRLRFQF